MKNEELRMKSVSMLFCEKLLLKENESTAVQCKPQLFTLHSSLLTLNRRKEVK